MLRITRNKKGFIASILVDILSWVIFALALIVFYLIFKFAVQNTTMMISSAINHDSFFPSVHLLRSDFDKTHSYSEVIINSALSGDFESIEKDIHNRYHYISEDSGPFYYALTLCPEHDNARDCKSILSSGYSLTDRQFQNSFASQIPTHSSRNIFVNFEYAAGKYRNININAP